MADNLKPLVYSCSGCSNLAQTANQLALSLNREGLAEMSCIAGVGGHVPALVKKATSGRKIIAIDGCHLACTKACLSQQQVTPDQHLVLTNYGYKKRYHQEPDNKDVEELLLLTKKVAEELHGTS